MIGRTRHLVKRHTPPSGPDDLVDGELLPHVAQRDDLSSPACATKITSASGQAETAARAPPGRGGSKFGMSLARAAGSERPWCSSRRIPWATPALSESGSHVDWPRFPPDRLGSGRGAVPSSSRTPAFSDRREGRFSADGADAGRGSVPDDKGGRCLLTGSPGSSFRWPPCCA